jgi:hypothetical protein
MPFTIPPGADDLLKTQADVIARRQSASDTISADAMRGRVRGGRWLRLQRGVYATFTGEPTREAELWAPLLRAGPGATLSHHTAAERHGLLDRPSTLIAITVPTGRHPGQRKIPGVVIHRSGSIDRKRHPVMQPPCVRVEDTVLDLIEISADFAEAYDWICRAIGRRRTTAERIAQAMAARKKMRWRYELEIALGDAGAGVLSVLERRYVRGVERPHGLPEAQRQFRIRQRTGSRYLDNLYADLGICVEVDGAAAHPPDEQRRDKQRDNWNLIHKGIATIRLGLLDLHCETARELATCFNANGWEGQPHPCAAQTCALS